MSDSPARSRRVPRPALLAGVVVLAVSGLTLVTVAATRDPAEPPESTAAPATAPATLPATAAPATSRGELTTGPLMDTSAPTHVSIPDLRVSVPLIGLGRRSDGTMEVPGDAVSVGWYTKAPTPGSLGPAVLAGHVDFHKKAGSFARLGTLRAGADVVIDRADGSVATFTVTKVERYPKNRFPTEAVYGAIDHAGLRLITCGGEFDRSAGHYRDNVVAYATLTRPAPAAADQVPQNVR